MFVSVWGRRQAGCSPAVLSISTWVPHGMFPGPLDKVIQHRAFTRCRVLPGSLVPDQVDWESDVRVDTSCAPFSSSLHLARFASGLLGWELRNRLLQPLAERFVN